MAFISLTLCWPFIKGLCACFWQVISLIAVPYAATSISVFPLGTIHYRFHRAKISFVTLQIYHAYARVPWGAYICGKKTCPFFCRCPACRKLYKISTVSAVSFFKSVSDWSRTGTSNQMLIEPLRRAGSQVSERRLKSIVVWMRREKLIAVAQVVDYKRLRFGRVFTHLIPHVSVLCPDTSPTSSFRYYASMILRKSQFKRFIVCATTFQHSSSFW